MTIMCFHRQYSKYPNKRVIYNHNIRSWGILKKSSRRIINSSRVRKKGGSIPLIRATIFRTVGLHARERTIPEYRYKADYHDSTNYTALPVYTSHQYRRRWYAIMLSSPSRPILPAYRDCFAPPWIISSRDWPIHAFSRADLSLFLSVIRIDYMTRRSSFLVYLYFTVIWSGMK